MRIGIATPEPWHSREHVPQKWEPVLRKRTCSNKVIERDDDSKKSHPARKRPTSFLLSIVSLAVAVAAVLLVAGAIDGALAQSSPFGAPRPHMPAAPVGGVLGW